MLLLIARGDGGKEFNSPPFVQASAGMKRIVYERHEFHGEPERRSAELSVLVYDIPYIGACGIFPPLHIVNEIFASGGSEGGMSPGATWQPFEISSAEYEELVEVIRFLDPQSLGDRARYTGVKYEFDSDFDDIREWQLWISAVCQKHRGSYHRRQDGA